MRNALSHEPAAYLAVLFMIGMAVIAGWDIYATFINPEFFSVSQIVNEWGRRWPVLTLLLGLVLGHLFWTGKTNHGTR